MNRVLSRLVGIGVASVMLAACAPAEPPARDDGRPKDKPQALNVAVLHSDAGAPGKKVLSRARISTKSGDILILEPDGSVSEVALDTPGGRDAFAVSEADLAMLNENLGLDLGGVAPMAVHEDVDLVARLRLAGALVDERRRPPVRTSGRTRSRVDGGFASYLAALGPVAAEAAPR